MQRQSSHGHLRRSLTPDAVFLARPSLVVPLLRCFAINSDMVLSIVAFRYGRTGQSPVHGDICGRETARAVPLIAAWKRPAPEAEGAPAFCRSG